MSLAKTPPPPYYAVIFSNILSDKTEGYHSTAEYMVELAKKQPGFLGVESARDEIGITISYWKNLESIKNWKANSEHLVAQETGKKIWYKNYTTRIALVEREYSLEK